MDLDLVDAKRPRNLIWAIAAALFTAQIYSRDTEGYTPICSELLCWVVLVAFSKFAPYIWNETFGESHLVPEAPLRLLPWMIAASISVSTLSFSIDDGSWIIVGSSGLANPA